MSGTFAFTYYVGTSATGPETSTPPVDAGTYTVVASFTSSDPDYSNAQSAPTTFTITPAVTATSVAAASATSVYGQADTLTATVTSAAGTPNAGTVTFYNGTTPLGTANVNNGVAVLPATTLTAGFDVVTATYNGDGLDFAGSSSILTAASLIQTVAGTGVGGFNGNNQSATSAELNQPESVALDSKGDLYIADELNNVVWKVDATTHIMTIVAGTGVGGYNGDGIAATSAELNRPTGIALDSHGNLFIADYLNSRVREVSAATGLISTVAGTGGFGYNGDGFAATAAELNFPTAVAFDPAGNLYIADSANQRIREVYAIDGRIRTAAGTGVQGFNGEGLYATNAELNYPRDIAFDAAGDLFISDSNNALVREVSATSGIISAVAGTGTEGYNGDGVAATSAELTEPFGIAIDSAGNLFILDLTRLREVSASTGLISTIAGTSFAGYNGDGIPAGDAEMYYPFGLAVDSVDDVFIADSQNNRVREIASGATSVTVTPTAPMVAINSAGGTFTGSPLGGKRHGRGRHRRRRRHTRQHIGGRVSHLDVLRRHHRDGDALIGSADRRRHLHGRRLVPWEPGLHERERYGHVLHFAGRVHAHHRRDRCQRNVHGSTLCGERLRHGEQFADPHRPVSRFLDSSRQQQHQPRVRRGDRQLRQHVRHGHDVWLGLPDNARRVRDGPRIRRFAVCFRREIRCQREPRLVDFDRRCAEFCHCRRWLGQRLRDGRGLRGRFSNDERRLSDHGQCERKRLRCRAQSNRLQCHLGNLPRRKRLGVRRRDRPRQGRQRVCRRRHGGDRFSAQKPDSAAEQWR